MKLEIEHVVKQIVLANADDEIDSIAVIIIKKDKEPEIHMAVTSDYAFEFNGVVDMLKVDALKIMSDKAEKAKDRR